MGICGTGPMYGFGMAGIIMGGVGCVIACCAFFGVLLPLALRGLCLCRGEGVLPRADVEFQWACQSCCPCHGVWY